MKEEGVEIVLVPMQDREHEADKAEFDVSVFYSV